MNHKLMFAVAALISMPLIASAQSDKTGKPGTTPKPADVTVQKASSGPSVHTAAELMGMEVRNSQGEKLGKIEDVVVYSNGQVAYAVLSFGGVLGMGDKLFAIPWGCVHTANRTDRTSRDNHVVLDIDKERLKAAPGFDKDNWPALADVAWCADVDKYYASEKKVSGRPVEASAPANALTLRASQLKGKNVENAAGEKLGDIKEIVLDPANGRASYVALSVGGFLGIGDRLVAVPWEAIKVVQDGDKEKLVLDASKEKLEKAPEFFLGETRWIEMSDPIFIGRVYDYYAVRPYWSATTPPAVRDPSKKN